LKTTVFGETAVDLGEHPVNNFIHLEIRITGLPDYRITGLPDYRITGLPDYRITGLLVDSQTE